MGTSGKMATPFWKGANGGNHWNLGVGYAPAEYNPSVHGPYNPGKWYGEPDTALRDVKLGELKAWVGRRNTHPVAIARAFGRGVHRWQATWMFPKHASAAGWLQFIVGWSTFWVINFAQSSRNMEKSYKYH